MGTDSVYNMSFMDNATNPLDLIVGLGSTLSQDFLIGNLLLVTFFLIFLILAVRGNFLEVFIIDGFLTTILALLLYTAGMVAAPTIAYPAVLFFLTLVFFLFNKN